MYADDRRAVFMLKLENPACSMFSAVFRVRWHPSETNCCRGSRALCTNWSKEPSMNNKDEKAGVKNAQTESQRRLLHRTARSTWCSNMLDE